MMRIGFAGYSCAFAAMLSIASPAPTNTFNS
jgi:hypothetical protein